MHARVLSNLQKCLPSIFTKFARWWEIAHIGKLRRPPQTLNGNSKSQTKCANPLETLLASNMTYYIQVLRDIKWCSFIVWSPNMYYLNSPPN